MGVWFSIKARAARFFQFWKDLACAVFDVWFEREECADYDGEGIGIPVELVERITLLAEHGSCYRARKALSEKHGTEESMCPVCFYPENKNRPDYWSCNREGPSAVRWLKENGLPVPKPRGWKPSDSEKDNA